VKIGGLLRAPLEIDPLRAAGAFGALAGVGSLLEPYLLGLTEALAAIGLLAWAVRVRTRRLRTSPARDRWVVVGVSGALAFALFAVPPWAILRGSLLGLATAALAVTTERTLAGPEVER